MGRAWADQGRGKKDWNYSCDSVFGIFITNFHMPEGDDEIVELVEKPKYKPVTEILSMDRDTHEIYSLKNRMFIIDLKALDIDSEDDVKNDLEGWIFNLINMGNYTSRPKLADKEPFERLFSLAEVANMSDAEYRKYSRSLKQYWDTCATEDTDNWRYERGLKQGEKIGEKRGEQKEKISNSLKMFLKGFDRETVIDTLELTDDEIKLFDEAIEQTK